MDQLLGVRNQRQLLDQIYASDAIISIVGGIIALIVPHYILTHNPIIHDEKQYNHNVHEVMRLYGCFRIAFGYILWYVRINIDDGIFRKHICESLFICYTVQIMVILRAQLTSTIKESSSSSSYIINYGAIIILSVFAFAYGSFRFSKGGNMIKVYELPSAIHP